MNMNINEAIAQRLDGTDDFSLARCLAIGLLETLTNSGHELSFELFQGTADANSLLAVIVAVIDFANSNMAIIRRFATSDFDTFCEGVREGDSNE